MSKKSKRIIISVILLIVVVFFVATTFQRQYRNVLLEMIIHPSTDAWGGNARVYRLVVQNNGTLISYSGISIDNRNLIERFNILMWPVVRRRSRVRLSNEDFQNISEMVFILSENQAIPLRTMSQWRMILLHDENIYRSGLEFYIIVDELLRLSPLTNHHPLIHPDFLEELLREFGN